MKRLSALSPLIRRQLYVVLVYLVLHVALALVSTRHGFFLASTSLTGLGIMTLTLVVVVLRIYVLFAVPAFCVWALAMFRAK